MYQKNNIGIDKSYEVNTFDGLAVYDIEEDEEGDDDENDDGEEGDEEENNNSDGEDEVNNINCDQNNSFSEEI